MLIVCLWQVVRMLTCFFSDFDDNEEGDIVPDSENEEECDLIQQALK